MPNIAAGSPWRTAYQNSFSGGQDASRSPSTLDQDQFARGVNLTCRGGVLSPRPGFIKHTLNFATGVQTPFQTGYHQRSGWYDSDNPAIMSSIGGRQFKIDIGTMTVTEITPTKAASTTTTANFTIPAVNTSVAVAVTSTAGMYANLTQITIGGYIFTLQSIDSAIQITVINYNAAAVGTIVNFPATVTFNTYDPNSPTIKLGWQTQAENYWLYQDNQSAPIIFDGATARRAVEAKKEVPVGNVMSYAQGRLVVALPDRQSFRVGDLFGGASSVGGDPRTAILYFSENDFLNEGGDFQARVFGAPSNSGPIMAMRSVAMTDSQLGQGPLMVGTPNCVFTVNLPFDRSTWKNLSNALQTVVPIQGPLGQESTVLINTDIWYRSIDGIRSYIMAWRQMNGGWGNTPMSQELGELMDGDTSYLLEWGSAALFNNRMLMTVSPVDGPRGIYHRGLVSLDFDLVSTIRHKAGPAWEGIWTGLNVLQIVRGLVNQKERCFILAMNGQDQIELWEIDPSEVFDNQTTPIQWTVDFMSYNFQGVDDMKRLETARMSFDRIIGNVTMTATYRTDLNPCWQPWDVVNLCAQYQDCGPAQCTGPITYNAQVRAEVTLTQPPDTFDPINGRKYRTGFEFQPRLAFTGFAELRSMRLYAVGEPDALLQERTLI